MEENFHGHLNTWGNEKIRANKSPENDPAEVGDVAEQERESGKREQEFGRQKQACLACLEQDGASSSAPSAFSNSSHSSETPVQRQPIQRVREFQFGQMI